MASRSDDDRVVEIQLGRPTRSDAEVVARCHLELPVVVEVPPHLDDGTPFPTLYWLTCPLARTRIGRLEGAGGVRRMEQKVAADAGFGARLAEAHDSYRALREAKVVKTELPAPSGGVGGAANGVKCLHAHYAHTVAGGLNPVGELVESWVGPLDCPVPCVAEGEPNPEWVSLP